MGNSHSAHPRRLTPHEVESTKIDSYTDLANATIGSEVVEFSDECFGKAANVIAPANPAPSSQNFTEHDADINGWQTRRHSGGHDFVIIKFAFPGSLAGFDISTVNFSGNHAPFAAVDACFVGSKKGANYNWQEILPRTPIDPNSHNVFSLPLESTDPVYDHIRLRIFPDGGVARFRVFGNVVPLWGPEPSEKVIDLAFVGNGGRVVSCSDEYFAPMGNLNLPGRAADTRGGWLTKRNWSRFAKEWAVIHLGATGLLSSVEVDTGHFHGCQPNEVSVEGCYSMEERPEDDVDISWTVLLPRTRVSPDAVHRFDFPNQVRDVRFTHVRLSLFPDGGLSRVRVYGRVAPDVTAAPDAQTPRPARQTSPPASTQRRPPQPSHSRASLTASEAHTAGVGRSPSRKSLRGRNSSASGFSTAEETSPGHRAPKRKRSHLSIA